MLLSEFLTHDNKLLESTCLFLGEKSFTGDVVNLLSKPVDNKLDESLVVVVGAYSWKKCFCLQEPICLFF